MKINEYCLNGTKETCAPSADAMEYTFLFFLEDISLLKRICQKMWALEFV